MQAITVVLEIILTLTVLWEDDKATALLPDQHSAGAGYGGGGKEGSPGKLLLARAE